MPSVCRLHRASTHEKRYVLHSFVQSTTLDLEVIAHNSTDSWNLETGRSNNLTGKMQKPTLRHPHTTRPPTNEHRRTPKKHTQTEHRFTHAYNGTSTAEGNPCMLRARAADTPFEKKTVTTAHTARHPNGRFVGHALQSSHLKTGVNAVLHAGLYIFLVEEDKLLGHMVLL